MTPYADFTYFGLLLLYIVIPTVALGMLGRANASWTILATVIALAVQFSEVNVVFPNAQLREMWIVLGWGLFQGCLAGALG